MGDYILFNSQYKEISKSSKWKGTFIIFSSGLITRLILLAAVSNPNLVEKLYSANIYPYIARFLGLISNLIPFSIAEALLILIAIFIVISLFYIILNPKFILNNIHSIFHYSVRSLAIIYILFYLLWGFNYYREDYSTLASMSKDPATYNELKELTLEKIRKTNAVRENLTEDDNGIFLLEDPIEELGKIANESFQNYKVGDLSLDGNYGKIKPAFLSKYMSYTGIVGIYIPFTSEPTINIDVPSQSILSTISHEIAHQRGFAKEDEANFISYKANINNPDVRFQYSGYYLAMTHLIDELYRQNSDDYPLVFDEISDGVKRDLEYSREYWSARKGKIRERFNTINDNYLKANDQDDGVKSYSGIVNLLLAEYKSK